MWTFQARTLSKKFLRQLSSGSKPVPPAYQYMSPWKRLNQELGFGGEEKPFIPRETNFLIVGGGLVGMSLAYWLKAYSNKYSGQSKVVVVERDPSYTRASSVLSCGGLRHQFSLAENIQLSMYTTEFLQEIKEHLSILGENDPPDVQFNHQGYLFLEGPEKAEKLAKMVDMQNQMGAKIRLLTKSQLKEKFPWINLENVEVGSYGIQGEGWFDPYLFLRCLYQKNLALGIDIVHGELDRFEFQPGPLGKDRLSGAYIKTNDGQEHGIKSTLVFNCAGSWAREIAMKANLCSKDCSDFAVQPRKRYVYTFHCPDGPGIESPFFVDTTGVYFRREGLGGNYICGASPSKDYEPPTDDLSVDYKFFEEAIWPQLAYRVPKFKNLKLKSGWAGYYDFNEFDQNLIIGPHEKYPNFYFVNGLSGHGIQHAIGVGRGVAEYIYDNTFMSIDLSKFSFDRIEKNERLNEEMIV